MMLPRSVAWLTGMHLRTFEHKHPGLILLRIAGPGIYHGTLTFPAPSSDHLHPGDGIIESASLVPYPAEPLSPTPISHSDPFSDHQNDPDGIGRLEMPISMALTEWHFILLYEDKVRVIGLLSDKVVYEEPLNLVSPFAVLALKVAAFFPYLERGTAGRSSTFTNRGGSSAEDLLAIHRSVHL